MNPTHIIIHHSLTRDTETVSWDAIKRYHVETMGFDDVGYHFGIERVGEDKFVTFKGRNPYKPGAHCKQEGMNRKSIGICCVGNYDEIFPPPMMIDALVTLCRFLMAGFNIPVENIKAHRDYASYKTCPGKEFDMDALRQRLT